MQFCPELLGTMDVQFCPELLGVMKVRFCIELLGAMDVQFCPELFGATVVSFVLNCWGTWMCNLSCIAAILFLVFMLAQMLLCCHFDATQLLFDCYSATIQLLCNYTLPTFHKQTFLLLPFSANRSRIAAK